MRRLKAWQKILPKKLKCSICNKKLEFNGLNRRISVVFDHKNRGKEPIKYKPSNWLRSHNKNSESVKIWKKSNFGILCRKCNMFLPTNINRRKKIVKRLIKYVFTEYQKRKI